jgi:hypothetical protein
MTMDGQIKWKTDQQPPFVRGGSVLADGLMLTTDGNTKLYLIELNLVSAGEVADRASVRAVASPSL